MLVQRFRMQAQVLLPGRLFRGVLLHPGFPTLAGSSVAAGKGERPNVGVGNSNLFVRVFRIKPDYGLFQTRTRAPVENVALDFGSVLAGNSDVAAVVEGFFERLPEFFLAGQGRDPALQLLVCSSR